MKIPDACQAFSPDRHYDFSSSIAGMDRGGGGAPTAGNGAGNSGSRFGAGGGGVRWDGGERPGQQEPAGVGVALTGGPQPETATHPGTP